MNLCDRDKSKVRLLIPALVMAVIAVGTAVGAAAAATCPVCGTAMGEQAVTVTDWETNREHRYHDLSCAVRDMQGRFPWSRATTVSPASGQRITLSRVSGTWRAQPEEAAVLLLTQGQDCAGALAFATAAEAQGYRDRHGQPGTAITSLASLPASLASRPAPAIAAAAANAPQGGGAPAAMQPAGSAVVAPAFTDVPAEHWAAEFVARVKAAGLMEGFPDGTFRGGEPITRYQMAAIVARLLESGESVVLEQPATPRPQTPPVEPTAPTPAAAVKPVTPAPEAASAEPRPARTSLHGLSGLLTIPDAHVRSAGSMTGVVGNISDRFLGAAAAGLGDGIEVGVTAARIGEDDRLFLSAKKRLEGVDVRGGDVAVGVTGVGADSAAFVAVTRAVRAVGRQAALTVGLGTGGVLDGLFVGAEAPVSPRIVPFAKSAAMLVESVDDGHGRDFNYGLALNVQPHLDLKVGSVEGRLAAGVLLGRRF